MKKTFSDKVRDIVRKIPKSKTMTYKEVASKAGNPKAARAVGAVMRSNYDPSIPCHRVVASRGSLGGFMNAIDGNPIAIKRWLLTHEGYRFGA